MSKERDILRFDCDYLDEAGHHEQQQHDDDDAEVVPPPHGQAHGVVGLSGVVALLGVSTGPAS